MCNRKRIKTLVDIQTLHLYNNSFRSQWLVNLFRVWVIIIIVKMSNTNPGGKTCLQNCQHQERLIVPLKIVIQAHGSND